MALRVVPALSLRQANALVDDLHRHHKATQGHKWSILAYDDDRLVGAAIVGRPLARMLQDGTTAEVVRLVTDGTPNACSKLYAACWRAWRAMGGVRMFTYILGSESGCSLKAAGWRFDRWTDDEEGWDRPSRPRLGEHLGPKQRWAAHPEPRHD